MTLKILQAELFVGALRGIGMAITICLMFHAKAPCQNLSLHFWSHIALKMPYAKQSHLGGDADTMACIAGSIAEAFYRGVPDSIAAEVHGLLEEDLLDVLKCFSSTFEV
jgi:hypothetical protein